MSASQYPPNKSTRQLALDTYPHTSTPIMVNVTPSATPASTASSIFCGGKIFTYMKATTAGFVQGVRVMDQVTMQVLRTVTIGAGWFLATIQKLEDDLVLFTWANNTATAAGQACYILYRPSTDTVGTTYSSVAIRTNTFFMGCLYDGNIPAIYPMSQDSTPTNWWQKFPINKAALTIDTSSSATITSTTNGYISNVYIPPHNTLGGKVYVWGGGASVLEYNSMDAFIASATWSSPNKNINLTTFFASGMTIYPLGSTYFHTPTNLSMNANVGTLIMANYQGSDFFRLNGSILEIYTGIAPTAVNLSTNTPVVNHFAIAINNNGNSAGGQQALTYVWNGTRYFVGFTPTTSSFSSNYYVMPYSTLTISKLTSDGTSRIKQYTVLNSHQYPNGRTCFGVFTTTVSGKAILNIVLQHSGDSNTSFIEQMDISDLLDEVALL